MNAHWIEVPERAVIQRIISRSGRKGMLRWQVFENLLGCEETEARALCHYYGFDPDRELDHANEDGEWV